MKVLHATLLSALAAVAVAAVVFPGFPAAAQEITQTSRSTIQAGTREHLELARFLADVSLRKDLKGSQLYDLTASKDAFHVTYTQTLSAKRVHAPNPPTGLPTTGNPGDTYKVSHCTQSTMQEWEFTWIQVVPGKWGWVTTSYSTTYVRRCSIDPPPG